MITRQYQCFAVEPLGYDPVYTVVTLRLCDNHKETISLYIKDASMFIVGGVYNAIFNKAED